MINKIKFEILSKSNMAKIISGESLILKNNTNLNKIKDKILISKSLTPMDSPYLLYSLGGIIENGIYLSHMSIFAREKKIFLIKVNDINLFKNNKKLIIDFNKKIITIDNL